MARNRVLGFFTCPCFASTKEETQAPLSDSVNVSSSAPLQGTGQGTASSASTSAPLQGTASSASTVQQVPSCRLVPLPRQRDCPSNAVGIDDQVNDVIRHLEWENETEVAVAVILHGLGGTGKTILANAVVAKLDIEGWNYSTVLPPGSTRNLEDCQGEIQEKQAFIYIDNDMVLGEHLQKLLRDESSKKKLRLLLTARDETIADVLSACGINTHVYHVRPLHSDDARKLLCQKMGVADTMQTPQIDEILKICDGLPLVLERVGEYICSQSQDKDEAFSRVIEEYIIEHKGLLFDLDELRQASAMETFLDVCSFFNGWDWDKVSCIMGEDKLNTLRKRALLLKKEECENYKVSVRHIVLMIGRRMAQDKRFTNAHDLSKALEGNDQAIGRISGIWLQDNISEPVFISAKKLDLMRNSLRVLALGDMAIVVDGQCQIQLFKQIIYFQAGLIPYIPFHPVNAQELRFLDCRLPHNIDDLLLNKMSSKLKVLNLNGDQYDRPFKTQSNFGRLKDLRTFKMVEFRTLINFPGDPTLLTQLEELDLSGCRNLVQLPEGLAYLRSLRKLSLRSCESLQELPGSFGKLRSLKYLDLHSCRTLKQLPKDFGLLSSLEELDLGYCSSLKELPSSFGKLSSLKLLTLVGCENLNHLPDDIKNLSALVRIEFERSMVEFQNSHLVSIPCRNIKFAKINFSSEWCRELTTLPKRLIESTSLRSLDIYGWSNLERLPEGFGQLKSLVELSIQWCSSLQHLSSDFHCLASLQTLNLEWCEKLEGKWMDSVGKIKTLELVDIIGSPMLEERWTEMAGEGESQHFAVRIGYSEKWNWKNVEIVLNKSALKLFTGECLLTNSCGQPFCLSTVAPNTVILLLYHYPCRPNIDADYQSKWKLLEEVVKHEDPRPFQMVYVGKCFEELPKGIAEKIMAYASVDTDAHLFFKKAFNIKINSSIDSPEFVVTEIVADEEGRKHFSRWVNIGDSFVEFLLSKSTLYSDLQKLTEQPQETNVKLLSALFDSTAESTTRSIFVRNYTENIGIEEFRGKRVLLFIGLDEHHVIDEHLFRVLTEIYHQARTNNDMEIVSIPIPVEVQGEHPILPGSDMARFETTLRKVPWPVLRNPWSLKTEVYYFLIGEYWGQVIPAILAVVEPNGTISNKDALPLVKKWGADVYPFTEEKMNELKSKPRLPRVEESSVEHRAEIPMPCVEESSVEQHTEIPLEPLPVSLFEVDSTRGGMLVESPLDLRGVSGCPLVWPTWEDESDIEEEDLVTQTAIIFPARPPRYW